MMEDAESTRAHNANAVATSASCLCKPGLVPPRRFGPLRSTLLALITTSSNG